LQQYCLVKYEKNMTDEKMLEILESLILAVKTGDIDKLVSLYGKNLQPGQTINDIGFFNDHLTQIFDFEPLLQNKALQQNSKHSLLQLAAYLGCDENSEHLIKVVEFLLQQKADILYTVSVSIELDSVKEGYIRQVELNALYYAHARGLALTSSMGETIEKERQKNFNIIENLLAEDVTDGNMLKIKVDEEPRSAPRKKADSAEDKPDIEIVSNQKVITFFQEKTLDAQIDAEKERIESKEKIKQQRIEALHASLSALSENKDEQLADREKAINEKSRLESAEKRVEERPAEIMRNEEKIDFDDSYSDVGFFSGLGLKSSVRVPRNDNKRTVSPATTTPLYHHLYHAQVTSGSSERVSAGESSSVGLPADWQQGYQEIKVELKNFGKRQAQAEERLSKVELQCQTLDARITAIEKTMDFIKQEITQMEKEISNIRAVIEPLEKVRNYLNSSISGIFFRTFTAKLDQLFHAYRVLQTGLFVPDRKAGEVVAWLSLLGSLIATPVPWVGATVQSIFSLGSEAIKSKLRERRKEVIARMVEIINFPTDRLTAIVNNTAIRLLDKYKTQVQYITAEGAEKLAERAVLRIIICLSTGCFDSPKEEDEVVNYLIAAVEAVRINPEHLPPLSIPNLLLETGERVKFTDEYIFQKTVLRVGDEYFPRNAISSDQKTLKYDYNYHLATKDEQAMVLKLCYQPAIEVIRDINELAGNEKKKKKCVIL